MNTKFLLKNLKGRNYLEDLGMNGCVYIIKEVINFWVETINSLKKTAT